MDRTIVTALLGAATLVACGDSERTVIIPPPVPSCAAPLEPLRHWWPGDGNANDILGGLHGTMGGGVTFAPGLVKSGGGRAFRFDGIDAMVVVPHDERLDPVGPFTVQAWARPGALPTPNGAVVGKGHPWDESYVIDHIDGRWRAFVRTSGGGDVRIHAEALQPGTWTHLALTWDGQTLAFYVNGALAGSSLLATPLNRSDAFLGIGARSEVGFADSELDLEFAGDVEEVAISGRALTATEVKAVHDAGPLGMCKP